MDDDAFAVADDEQRRVVELQGVIGELLEGGGEVAAGLLVFPAEVAPLPDVGPAVATTGFFGAALEAVVVRVAGFGDAEQVAEVVKMGLRPGALGERIVFPGGDELLGRHGGRLVGGSNKLRSVTMPTELRSSHWRLARFLTIFRVHRSSGL